MTDDEMVGWYYWFTGHEFEQPLGDSERQGSLACYSPWGHKDSDMTEQLNNIYIYIYIYTHTHGPRIINTFLLPGVLVSRCASVQVCWVSKCAGV